MLSNKTKTQKKYTFLRAFIVLFTILGVGLHSPLAFATEELIFSNEVEEENANRMILDNDNTGGDVILQFGDTLNERLYWDNAGTKFIFTDDVNVTGNLDVDGIIYSGSSNTAITQADGKINGEVIADDTIDDDSIDFGMGADQVGADDITMTDEFDNSNGTNVQDVMDDVDAAIGNRTYTEDNYVTDGESITNSLDALDQQIKDNADGISGGSSSTNSNTFTMDADDTGGNVDLIFGTTLGEYLRHDGTLFHLSDDLRMDTTDKIEFRDSALAINSSADGQLDIDADTEVEITAPNVDLNGNLDVSGTINGTTLSTTQLDFQGNATVGTNDDTLAINTSDWDISTTGDLTGVSFDANGAGNSITNIESADITDGTLTNDDINANANIAFSKLAARTKKIKINMNDKTIAADGSSNLANMYTDAETGANPHQFYIVKSLQAGLQDLDLVMKIKLPEDFVDFTTASNDISFDYKNTGTNNTDSKIDILIEDNDGDDAYTAADGQGLFSATWATYSDEFDGASFDPVAGEYIYLTIKGYASYDSGFQSPYIGEIVLTYTGR